MDLTGAPAGRFADIRFTPTTTSTNTDVVAAALLRPAVASVLCTDEQTAGRGRRGRTWNMAPGGGLLVSFYVPWLHQSTAHSVPTALGVAAVDAIAEHGRTVGLKWPNDILAEDGRKVAGMLSETVSHNGSFLGVVAGLGCNTSWPDPSVAGFEGAANLDELGDGVIDRACLLASLVKRMDAELSGIESHGVDALHDRYRTRCVTLGTSVRVEQGSTAIEGVAMDIDRDGALILDVAGVHRRVDVGDVVHLRPVDSRGD